MRWIPSRDYVFFLVAIVTGVVAIVVFAAPDLLPVPLQDITRVTDALSLTQIGWIVAVVMLLIVVARFLNGVGAELDRSEITGEPPELASNGSVRDPTQSLTVTYTELLEPFESPEKVQRRIAMYGRRAGEHNELPEGYTQFFDEIAVTARDTYATSSTIDADTAEEAIKTGTWTDDRVAAAFLASDIEAEPTFTLVERVTAWLAPQRAFEHRLNRTVAAIEDCAESYLTYTNPRSEMQTHTGPDAEQGNI
jgi:hypothetical protein